MVSDPVAANFTETDIAHVVQLFDSERSSVEGVSEFVHQGLARREQILVVMNPERWNAVAMRLSAFDSAVDEGLRVGRVIVCNVHDVLKKLIAADRPHRGVFEASVGTLVRGHAAFRRPLRIYDEMSDVLTARGLYKAALELEELWNELARRLRFTLLCGYTAGHFGDPHNAVDLRRLCAAHSTVAVDSQDVLASFLVNRLGAASPAFS